MRLNLLNADNYKHNMYLTKLVMYVIFIIKIIYSYIKLYKKKIIQNFKLHLKKRSLKTCIFANKHK